MHCVQEALRTFKALKRVGENKAGKDILNGLIRKIEILADDI